MSVEGTEATLREYLDALLNGGDFAWFFDDAVLWTTTHLCTGGRDLRAYISISALVQQLRDAAAVPA